MHSEPIYFRVLPDSQGNTGAVHKTVLLLKHFWGKLSAGHYYISAPFSILLRHWYTQSDTDSFLLSKHGLEGSIHISIMIDAFLIVATHFRFIDSFYVLSSKYAFKRLAAQHPSSSGRLPTHPVAALL